MVLDRFEAEQAFEMVAMRVIISLGCVTRALMLPGWKRDLLESLKIEEIKVRLVRGQS
jgi:hypothetical protein